MRTPVTQVDTCICGILKAWKELFLKKMFLNFNGFIEIFENGNPSPI